MRIFRLCCQNLKITTKGPFTYNVITEGEGGGLEMITLHVIVSNTTTVKVITEGGGGLETGQKLIS